MPGWPFEDQKRNPLARARHVAAMYRTALGLTNPVTMAELDDLILSYGEQWVTGRRFPYLDEDIVDTATAAEILGVSRQSVRKYRERGRLPGHIADGKWFYCIRDIKALRPLPSGRPIHGVVDDSA